jgi:hypothetical protein
MGGVQFQTLLGGYVRLPAKATLLAASTSALSGSFTVPSTSKLIVLALTFQQSSGAAQTCTIGGHAATLCASNSWGGAFADPSEIWAAMVSPGDPGSWARTNAVLNNSAALWGIYQVANVSALSVVGAGGVSGLTSLSYNLNVTKYSTVIAAAHGRGASISGCSFTAGVVNDNANIAIGVFRLAQGHLDQSADNGAYNVSVSIPGSVTSSSCAAAFSS